MDKSKRVYVYFNLHKKCWSVRQSGKVVKHTDRISLKDAKYLVGEAGRKRVLKEKKKNVHAGVSGFVVDEIPWPMDEISFPVTYNPYKNKTFVARDGIFDVDDPQPVTKSDYAYLDCNKEKNKVCAIWRKYP